MDLLSTACEKFGLVVNTQKTVVMHRPPPNSATAPNAPPLISVNGTQLQVVENFPYLGSTLSRNTKIDDEVANGISRASQAFGRLQSTLSPSHPEAELAGSNPRRRCAGRNGILSISAILRQMQLRWSDHLVRMDDKRLPKRLFYRDVATGSRSHGGQIRRYMDNLKSYLKRLQIIPTKWEEIAHDCPTWRRAVKTGAAIYEANRIAAAKAKCKARKSQLCSVRNPVAQPLPTCSRCQRPFRARVGLFGHLRINCISRTAPAIVQPPASSSSSSPPPTNSDNSSEPPFPSSSSSPPSSFSSSTAPTTAAQATVTRATTDTTTTSPDSSDEDQDYTCPHCDRTFTSHIGLVGHSRIHRTETGEPVPGAPTYTHRARLHCPHCPRTFRLRMGLFDQMRIHESGIDRKPDTPTTPSTSTTPSPTLAPSHCAPITTTTTTITASPAGETDAVDFTCPHCSRAFTSRIGLVELRRYTCEICQKPFGWKGALKEHVIGVHKRIDRPVPDEVVQGNA
nr:unnamed protein product [Spirometra erinaceieuropaei]